ncbi:MAG: zinc ribbon domain-containing protein [Acidobacteria bacterium]|nr:zinc ribbon domain-containing protein [Acidobacteriota bacterium]
MTTGSFYCPRCGHQQASESQKFCRNCGTQVNGILQLLNPDPQEKPKLTPGEDQLRQRDINLGSVLMLVAVIKVTLFLRFPPNLGIDPYFFILALLSLALGTLLLLSQLTHRRRGLTVGATMTFLAALIGLIGTFFWGIEVIPLIAIPTLFLIFTWYRLVLRVHQFFGSEPVSQMTDQQRYSTHEHLPAGQAALPPGDNLNAVDDLGLPNRQAVGQPVSVTEGTTELLKNQSQ